MSRFCNSGFRLSSEAAENLVVFSKRLILLEKDRELLHILRCWRENAHSFTAESSLKAWKPGPKAFVPLQMLKSKRDRVEYARYILTGEIFLQGARKTTGNPTFFTPLDESFYQRCEENIFYSVDINKLDYKDSLLTSTEKRFQDNLLKLKKNIKEGQIRVTVSTASISPSNKAILDEIKRLEPATIDWSNLVSCPTRLSSRSSRSQEQRNMACDVLGQTSLTTLPPRTSSPLRNSDQLREQTTLST